MLVHIHEREVSVEDVREWCSRKLKQKDKNKSRERQKTTHNKKTKNKSRERQKTTHNKKTKQTFLFETYISE